GRLLRDVVCNGMTAPSARRPSAGAVPGRWGACLAVRAPPAASRSRSIVVEDRAEAAILREPRIAAVAEQVQVERLVGLLLAVAVDDDGDRLFRLAGGEGQRAGLGDVVVVTVRGGAVRGLERHRHGLVVGGRERDREGEERRPVAVALLLGHIAD